MTTTALKTQYEKIKSENPKARIRDIAAQLGVSEVELVATKNENIQLVPQFEEMLNAISSFGKVMALTRNDHAAHERKGIYTKASFNGPVGLVVNPDIDLRLFMSAWKFVYAVNENDRRSIQFFDKYGHAIHKIYLLEESDFNAYQQFVDTYTAMLVIPPEVITTQAEAAQETADEEIDIEKFQEEWLNLKDTHHFFAMLKNYGVARRQAMRLAPEGHALALSTDKIETLLQTLSAEETDCMVFVGNGHCIQIHTGKVKQILRTGPWINVLDPEFNLHLRDQEAESVWLVKKPTDLGLVHSIEVYDRKGELIVQIFGKRKPNIPESEAWRKVIVQIV